MVTFDERFALVKGSIVAPLKDEELYPCGSLFSVNPEATETDTRATLYMVQCVDGPHAGKVGVIDYEKSAKYDKHNVYRSIEEYERMKGAIPFKTSMVVRLADGGEIIVLAALLLVVGHFVQLTPEPNVTYELFRRAKHGHPAWNLVLQHESEPSPPVACVKQERKSNTVVRAVDKAVDKVKTQMFTPLYKAATKVAGKHKRVMIQKKKTGEKPPIIKGIVESVKCAPQSLPMDLVLKVAANKAKFGAKKRSKK